MRPFSPAEICAFMLQGLAAALIAALLLENCVKFASRLRPWGKSAAGRLLLFLRRSIYQA